MELVENSNIIVAAAFSVVDTEYLISNYTQIRKACSSALMERAAEIEEIFLQNVDHLEKELQNTEMTHAAWNFRMSELSRSAQMGMAVGSVMCLWNGFGAAINKGCI